MPQQSADVDAAAPLMPMDDAVTLGLVATGVCVPPIQGHP
jgi:hypothetical protein